MTLEELKNKALLLPAKPGVYLMRDSENTVIYVGKAKKLCNRVSQYFLDMNSHSPKTRLMVSKVDHFDVILASSEFEALVLECAQIKRHMPKYNILLKDDKGYPYIRLALKDAYPRLVMVNKPQKDGALYFGPFGSRKLTQNLIDSINHILKLPSCNKQFDTQKGRPCLNYHLNQCDGWCQKSNSQSEYRRVIEDAKQILSGNYKSVLDAAKKQMLAASDALNFELAASLRDRIAAIDALGKRQYVTAGKCNDVDVIGFGSTESKACFAVLHFSKGELVDKEYEILSADDREAIVSSLLKQYYLGRKMAPKSILLPFPVSDSADFAEMLSQQMDRKVLIYAPQRGVNVRLVELACKNAQEEVERISDKEERRLSTLSLLSDMLNIPQIDRIESFDISNISGSDNVASMIVFVGGKPHKSDYKHFRVDLDGMQDDYGSMRQVVMRRFTNYLNSEKGFEKKPDLLLIDGGSRHANVAEQVLKELHIDIPVFGMVKDNRHRTRALITSDEREIGIDGQQAIFSFIGRIQEETHRFAIGYHRKLRSKRLRYSQLDEIPGIGPKRKQILLKNFQSIASIKEASLSELEHFLPHDAAAAVYQFFQKR